MGAQSSQAVREQVPIGSGRIIAISACLSDAKSLSATGIADSAICDVFTESVCGVFLDYMGLFEGTKDATDIERPSDLAVLGITVNRRSQQYSNEPEITQFISQTASRFGFRVLMEAICSKSGMITIWYTIWRPASGLPPPVRVFRDEFVPSEIEVASFKHFSEVSNCKEEEESNGRASDTTGKMGLTSVGITQSRESMPNKGPRIEIVTIPARRLRLVATVLPESHDEQSLRLSISGRESEVFSQMPKNVAQHGEVEPANNTNDFGCLLEHHSATSNSTQTESPPPIIKKSLGDSVQVDAEVDRWAAQLDEYLTQLMGPTGQRW
ncbi:hypothetical protein Pelo_14401 [Pelomyxa schiedti]|nr:hypothetical protein Pelo_14401 [Pelomyxa schiedti]